MVASAAFARIPQPADFENWTVVCDNVRHCEAMGLPSADGSDKEWTIHVSRRAEGDALPSIDAAPAFQEGEADPVRLRIDGLSTDLGFDGDGRAIADSSTLLRALAGARKAEVINSKGKMVGTIPVAGAAAALRWMDDRQERAGTTTAIIARGDRPASAVPAPPPLPRIVQPPVSHKSRRKLNPADIKAIQATSDLCDSERAHADTYRLDNQHSVGIVGCLMGAYQGASLIVVIDEKGKWAPARIEQPEPFAKDAEPYDSYLLTEAGFVEKDRLLFSAAKGRGLADCGESASWAWDGKMFRLRRRIVSRKCS
jgi:hypothetical protein